MLLTVSNIWSRFKPVRFATVPMVLHSKRLFRPSQLRRSLFPCAETAPEQEDGLFMRQPKNFLCRETHRALARENIPEPGANALQLVKIPEGMAGDARLTMVQIELFRRELLNVIRQLMPAQNIVRGFL
jgi:hypothetical protein